MLYHNLLYNRKKKFVDKFLLVNFEILVGVVYPHRPPDQVTVHHLNITLCEVTSLTIPQKLHDSLNVFII